jgi:hypothetical protein
MRCSSSTTVKNTTKVSELNTKAARDSVLCRLARASMRWRFALVQCPATAKIGIATAARNGVESVFFFHNQ